jgi:hypothetical protein
VVLDVNWKSTNISEEYITFAFLAASFNSRNGGYVFLWNVCWCSADYMAFCPRRCYSFFFMIFVSLFSGTGFVILNERMVVVCVLWSMQKEDVMTLLRYSLCTSWTVEWPLAAQKGLCFMRLVNEPKDIDVREWKKVLSTHVLYCM